MSIYSDDYDNDDDGHGHGDDDGHGHGDDDDDDDDDDDVLSLGFRSAFSPVTILLAEENLEDETGVRPWWWW